MLPPGVGHLAWYFVCTLCSKISKLLDPGLSVVLSSIRATLESPFDFWYKSLSGGHPSLTIIFATLNSSKCARPRLSCFYFLVREIKTCFRPAQQPASKAVCLLNQYLHQISDGGIGLLLCSRQESNLERRYRKPLFYPLNYGSRWGVATTVTKTGVKLQYLLNP